MKLPNKDASELEVIECLCGGHIGIDSTYVEQESHFFMKCPYCGNDLDTRVFDAEDGIIWLTRLEALETLQHFAKDIESMKRIREKGMDTDSLAEQLNMIFSSDTDLDAIKYKIANNSVDFIKKD